MWKNKTGSIADEISQSMDKLLVKNVSEDVYNTNKVSRAIDLVSMAADKLERINATKESTELTTFLEILASVDCEAKLKKEIKNKKDKKNESGKKEPAGVKGLKETGTPFPRKMFKADDHNAKDREKDALVIDTKDAEEIEDMFDSSFEDEK